MLAIDPGIDAHPLESESPPDASVNHFMAVKSVVLKQFVAVLECFPSEMSKRYSIIGVDLIQTTHCQDMLPKIESLP